jgi:hypothetical protein
MVINFLLGLLVVVLWGIVLASQSDKKINTYKGRNHNAGELINVDDKELQESVDR